MESKGLNFAIGFFVLAGIASIFIIGLWLAKKDSTDQTIPYEVHFEESVSGLSVGSRVSYRGIRIGSVTEISIHPSDPQLVLVRVNISERYPIHRGDVASLKLEGITGASYIDIEGAERGSELLTGSAGRPAIIPSRQSDLGQLVKGIPDLINEGTILVNRFSKLLNQENQEQLAAILVNVNEITTALAAQSENIDEVLATANDAGEAMIALSASIREVATQVDDLVVTLKLTADGANKLIAGRGAEMIGEWQNTAQALRELSDSALAIINTNQESLQNFSQDGLYEFTLFLQEARLLVASLTRVLERLEASGARFLLDQDIPEIEPN
jgi:phospholipid/cholesterol/gamma-HCH transport system substrate-binding protein